MLGKQQPDCQAVPGVHVIDVAGQTYAYDLNRQDLVAVESELADLLAGRSPGTPAALAALAAARRDDGLFTGRVPRLVPRSPEAAVDRDLEHLILTVTEDCDLRCAYCVHGAGLAWVRPQSPARMPIATARAAVAYFLDRCRTDRPPTISFSGGEALLHRGLIRATVAQIRAHPRGAEAVLAIDSNGYDWDAAALDLMVAERMHVQVSLDGPPAIHDRCRRDREGNPTCERILANLARLTARDKTAAERLAFVATLAPPVDLPAVADFYAKLPYFGAQRTTWPHLRVNFANLAGQDWPRDQEEAAGLPPVATQIERAREEYFAAIAAGSRADLGPVLRSLFEPDLYRVHHRSRAAAGAEFVPGGNCRPGRRRLHVAADGDLQPCERTGQAVPIGQVSSGIRPELVRRVERYFHEALEGRCADCWALRLCGVCYGAQAAHTRPGGGPAPVPEAVCRLMRARNEDTLRLLVRVLELPADRRQWLERPDAGQTGSAAVGECTCNCAEPVSAGEAPGPEVKQATVFYPVWYDING